MYWEKKWGHEVMGRKENRVCFGGGYTKRGKRKYLMFSLRVWVPYFPFSDLPWRFDNFKHIWIDLEEEDVMPYPKEVVIYKTQSVGPTALACSQAIEALPLLASRLRETNGK